jgi:DNA polymerase elongation subunit (family B)
MKATFIDCYVKNDDIVLWLRLPDGKNIKLIDRFIPEIYVRTHRPEILQRWFKKNGITSNIVKKKSFSGNIQLEVLSIPIDYISRYHHTIRYIEKLQGYAVEIFNADQKLEEIYMFQKDLFPTAKVEFTEENGILQSISVLDDSNAVDYEIPDFEKGNLHVKTKDSLYKTIDTKLVSITYNGQRFTGRSKNILEKFKKAFEEHDPDIIWTENGNLVLPYLRKLFDEHRISFNFSRFENDDFSYEKGESYWAYTNIIYRTASVFLKGRLHFDTKSFFADDTGYYGIIDGARVCRQRIQRIEMRSAGAAVTNLLLYESYKRNFLLPYKIGIYERFKTLEELYEADRGSMIFEPQVGFHTDIVEFDFVSLYPQIMWKHNLSPETLFCKCCPHHKVPSLHYNFCTKHRGVVSIVAENLVKRRIELKKQGTPEAKEKAGYLKWLLVTMFGYQAFKNRKIGIIEAHESIQAYAREIIMQTVRIAEFYGWEVVHGIVDSVYVKKKGYTKDDVEKLEREICKETGFKIAHEGNYRWMVFLPSIVNADQPVSNHFYGIFENGEIKCRGIEARRRDFPVIVQEMQLEMIEVLSEATNIVEFRRLFPKVLKVLKKYINKLPNATQNQLTIRRRISKTDYVNNIPQKIMLEAMSEDGWDIQPGQNITYIIKDVKNRNPRRRYIPSDAFKGEFDSQKYTEIMIRATFNILQPFGLTQRYIAEFINPTKQLTLDIFHDAEKTIQMGST